MYARDDSEDLIALDEVLGTLEKADPRAAHVVELRFFGGLSEDEVAEVLGVAAITVKRDWRAARAWLISRLADRAAVRREPRKGRREPALLAAYCRPPTAY